MTRVPNVPWTRRRPVVRSLLACALAVAPISSARAAPSGETWRSEPLRVEVVVPDGWEHRENSASASRLDVVFAPVDADGRVQLRLRAQPAGGLDAEAAREVSLGSVAGRDEYRAPAGVTGTLLGEERPGLRVGLETEQGEFVLRQLYLVRDGTLFIVETAASADDFDERLPGFDAFWEGLSFLPPTERQVARRRLEELAARCGHEIDWQPDWETAAARARETGRPVLVTLRRYPGFDLPDGAMRGVFMDRDVVALVEEGYVPLRLHAGMASPLDDPEVYGLGPHTFGQAALVVDADGALFVERQTASERFLRETLRAWEARPGARAADAPSSGDPLERAEQLARRGDLAGARAALGDLDTATAWRLRASSYRRERRADEAFAALEAAARAPGADALADDLRVDEAGLRLVTGDEDLGREAFEAFVADAPDHERLPEVLYVLGMARSAAGDRDGAAELLHRVVDEHGSSRWAWTAAAALTSPGWEVGREAQLGWPAGETVPELGRALAPFRYARGDRGGEGGTRRRAAALHAEALGELLDRQQDDGSWIAATEPGRARSDVPDDFELAITALAVQASLTGLDGDPRPERVTRAVERGLAWLHDAHARQVADGPEAYYMDYAVWSRSYLVAALVDGLEAGFGDRDAVARRVGVALAELGERQQAGGGWSYYVSGSLSDESGPAAVSISFTTAAAVLALARVADAELPHERAMLERATGCLRRMRNDNGTFTYMLFHEDEAGGRRDDPRGAAARGPVCSLALLRAEAGDLDDLRDSLALFEQHRAGFLAERGKLLMHTGDAGQGSHYLLFDLATTAAAVAALPPGERERHAAPLLEDVLAFRTEEGVYVDTLLLGRAYGTAMAVLAYDALR